MEIFLILSSIIFFSLATLGYGYIFLNLTKRYAYDLSLGEIGFLGFFAISLISLIFHFFIPLSSFFNTVLYLFGLIFLFSKLAKNKFKNFKNYKFLFLLILISIIMFIKHKPNEDFGYYHLPYITNLVYQKIIFGLSNLQLNQGWNSIWLNLSSTYYINILKFNGIFFSNVIFYIFCSLVLFEIIFKSRNNNSSLFVFVFSLFFLIFLNLKFSRLNSYGLDVPSNFIVIYIILLFFLYFQSINNNEKKFNILEYLILFSVFSLSFRVLNIITLILPLIIIISEKISLSKIFKSKIVLFSIFFLILFLLQQIIYTGCIIVPNKLTCISSLSWFDPNIIDNFNTDTSKVNKSYQSYVGPLSREEYLTNFNWVENWFMRHKIEIFEHIGTFMVPIFLYFLLLKYKLKKKNQFSFNNSIIYAFIFFSTCLIIWFIKAPVIRFGTVYIQALLLIFIIFISNKFFLIVPNKNLIIGLIAISLLGNSIKNTKRIFDYDNNSNLMPFIPEIIYSSQKNVEFQLNKPISNSNVAKSEYCWNVPVLCRISGFADLNILKVNSYLIIKKK